MKRNQLLAGAVLLSLAGWSGAAAAEDGNDRNRNTCDGNGGHR